MLIKKIKIHKTVSLDITISKFDSTTRDYRQPVEKRIYIYINIDIYEYGIKESRGKLER